MAPKTYNILTLPGDGIGPEIMAEAVKVLQTFSSPSLSFNLRSELIGGCSIDAHGTPVTEAVKQAALESDAVLFASVGGPKWDGSRRGLEGPEGGLLQLRKALDVYGNLRPCSTDVCGSVSREFSPYREEIVEGVDFVVLRENCGGAYFGKKVEEENYGMCSSTQFLFLGQVDVICMGRLLTVVKLWMNGDTQHRKCSASPVWPRTSPSDTTLPGLSSQWTKPTCSPLHVSGAELLRRPSLRSFPRSNSPTNSPIQLPSSWRQIHAH